MQFLQPCMNFSPISVNLTLEFPKKFKNPVLFERFVLSRNDQPLTWNAVLTTVPKFFCKNSNIFWLKFKSDKTINFFPQHQIFLELFLRTCRMQFCRPCMKLPHQTPWKWRYNSQKKFMCYSRDLFFFLGRIICRREKQVWPPCRNFPAKTPKNFD